MLLELSIHEAGGCDRLPQSIQAERWRVRPIEMRDERRRLGAQAGNRRGKRKTCDNMPHATRRAPARLALSALHGIPARAARADHDSVRGDADAVASSAWAGRGPRRRAGARSDRGCAARRRHRSRDRRAGADRHDGRDGAVSLRGSARRARRAHVSAPQLQRPAAAPSRVAGGRGHGRRRADAVAQRRRRRDRHGHVPKHRRRREPGREPGRHRVGRQARAPSPRRSSRRGRSCAPAKCSRPCRA